MNEQNALKNALKSRLEALRIRYPAYSLRAFAKRAGVSPATMSLMIQGKRPVSLRLAKSLSERLQFDPQERSEVLARALAINEDPAREAYVQISLDQYRLVSDWRAFAILNLINTVNFQSEHGWIANRLGLDKKEIDDVVESLLRLGMLEAKEGQYQRAISKYRTTEDVANSSLRKSHAQTLDLAQRSLERDAVSMRDFTWLTIPLDLNKMILAKTMIRKFQDDLSSAMETDAAATEVYRLAIQLFPLTMTAKKE